MSNATQVYRIESIDPRKVDLSVDVRSEDMKRSSKRTLAEISALWDLIKADGGIINTPAVCRRGKKIIAVDGRGRIAACVHGGVESMQAKIYEDLTDMQILKLGLSGNTFKSMRPSEIISVLKKLEESGVPFDGLELSRSTFAMYRSIKDMIEKAKEGGLDPSVARVLLNTVPISELRQLATESRDKTTAVLTDSKVTAASKAAESEVESVSKNRGKKKQGGAAKQVRRAVVAATKKSGIAAKKTPKQALADGKRAASQEANKKAAKDLASFKAKFQSDIRGRIKSNKDNMKSKMAKGTPDYYTMQGEVNALGWVLDRIV